MQINLFFEDMQKKVAALYAASPAKDIEANVKALLQQGFMKLDLVTREEFDLQQQLLERALLRIGELEKRLQSLEQLPKVGS